MGGVWGGRGSTCREVGSEFWDWTESWTRPWTIAETRGLGALPTQARVGVRGGGPATVMFLLRGVGGVGGGGEEADARGWSGRRPLTPPCTGEGALSEGWRWPPRTAAAEPEKDKHHVFTDDIGFGSVLAE